MFPGRAINTNRANIQAKSHRATTKKRTKNQVLLFDCVSFSILMQTCLFVSESLLFDGPLQNYVYMQKLSIMKRVSFKYARHLIYDCNLIRKCKTTRCCLVLIATPGCGCCRYFHATSMSNIVHCSKVSILTMVIIIFNVFSLKQATVVFFSRVNNVLLCSQRDRKAFKLWNNLHEFFASSSSTKCVLLLNVKRRVVIELVNFTWNGWSIDSQPICGTCL